MLSEFTEKNSIYLIAGYIVFLGGIASYLLSLALRRHNLRRDEAELEQIAEQLLQEQQAARTATTRVAGQQDATPAPPQAPAQTATPRH